jgi:hypothetical protein
MAVNNRLCAAFLPWLVFDLVARTGDGIAFAAGAALATAAVVALPNLRAHAPTTVETTGAVVFAGLAIAAAIAAPAPSSLFARIAVPLATGLLALVMLGSLLRVPATADYARKCVRPSTADGPRFAIINMTMSALWGVAFVLVAGSQTAAAFVAGPHVASVFGWLVPLAVLLAVTRATAGLWADYHERDVAGARADDLMDGLFWDIGPALFDDEG